jgi:hypothetical protein
MPKYDVGRYQEAVQKVRDAALKITDFPSEYHQRLRDIVREAVQGTLEACQEIYEPDLENIKNLGSDTDYETDKKGLKNLVGFFSPSNKIFRFSS